MSLVFHNSADVVIVDVISYWRSYKFRGNEFAVQWKKIKNHWQTQWHYARVLILIGGIRDKTTIDERMAIYDTMLSLPTTKPFNKVIYVGWKTRGTDDDRGVLVQTNSEDSSIFKFLTQLPKHATVGDRPSFLYWLQYCALINQRETLIISTCNKDWLKAALTLSFDKHKSVLLHDVDKDVFYSLNRPLVTKNKRIQQWILAYIEENWPAIVIKDLLPFIIKQKKDEPLNERLRLALRDYWKDETILFRTSDWNKLNENEDPRGAPLLEHVEKAASIVASYVKNEYNWTYYCSENNSNIPDDATFKLTTEILHHSSTFDYDHVHVEDLHIFQQPKNKLEYTLKTVYPHVWRTYYKGQNSCLPFQHMYINQDRQLLSFLRNMSSICIYNIRYDVALWTEGIGENIDAIWVKNDLLCILRKQDTHSSMVFLYVKVTVEEDNKQIQLYELKDEKLTVIDPTGIILQSEQTNNQDEYKFFILGQSDIKIANFLVTENTVDDDNEQLGEKYTVEKYDIEETIENGIILLEDVENVRKSEHHLKISTKEIVRTFTENSVVTLNTDQNLNDVKWITWMGSKCIVLLSKSGVVMTFDDNGRNLSIFTIDNNVICVSKRDNLLFFITSKKKGEQQLLTFTFNDVGTYTITTKTVTFPNAECIGWLVEEQQESIIDSNGNQMILTQQGTRVLKTTQLRFRNDKDNSLRYRIIDFSIWWSFWSMEMTNIHSMDHVYFENFHETVLYDIEVEEKDQWLVDGLEWEGKHPKVHPIFWYSKTWAKHVITKFVEFLTTT